MFRTKTLSILFFLVASTAAWSAEYAVLDLHPYWTYESVATDINDQNEVTGWLKTWNSTTVRQIFFYSKKKKYHYPSIYSLTAPVVNENGIVGGTASIYKYFSKGEQYPFTWGVEQLEKKVPIPKDWKVDATYLQDLNDQGEFLLTNGIDKESSTKVVIMSERREDQVSKLTFGKKMNVMAFVAGSILKGDKPVPASYNRTRRTAQELVTGFEGEAIAVNDLDDVVGMMVHQGQPFGFLQSTKLSTALPIPHFMPVDINIHMQILGYQLDEEGGPYPALWEDGSITRLQLLVEDHIEIVSVNAINNNGVIVGSIRNTKKDKKERAAMLMPKKGT